MDAVAVMQGKKAQSSREGGLRFFVWRLPASVITGSAANPTSGLTLGVTDGETNG